MKFKNVIEAIKFTLIDCAKMDIDVTFLNNINNRNQYQLMILNNKTLLYTEIIPEEIYIQINDNFDAKYIYIFNKIMQEQFNIETYQIKIAKDDFPLSKDDMNTLKEIFNDSSQITSDIVLDLKYYVVNLMKLK